MELRFKTFDKQRQALRFLRDRKTNEILYGGGARGGKSYLGCGWIIIECIQKPASKWLIAREELTKLKDTTLLTFFQAAKQLGVQDKVHFNAQSLTATFDNGSLIFFREIKYLPSDPEFDRLGSYDLTGCFLDECQQIHQKAINVLRGRFSVLRGDNWETIPKALYTCNPAKNWIYEFFVRPDREGKIEDGRVFVKSLATDNPFVPPEYIENLKKSDKITVQRLLYGNFEYDDDPAALIDYEKILDLFTNDFVAGDGRYITCDVARFGSDKTVIGIWSGFRVELYSYQHLSVSQVAEKIKEYQRKFSVPNSQTLCDEDGVGGGVVDILGCKGFVNNSRALPNPITYEDDNYTNLKSQCYFRLAERVNNNGMYIKCDDVNVRKMIISELEYVKQHNMDKDSKRQVLPKDKVKEVLGRSPDFADTLMMREWFELTPTIKLDRNINNQQHEEGKFNHIVHSLNDRIKWLL
jgi:phage terminase large subunit